jgi:hypothetical protein
MRRAAALLAALLAGAPLAAAEIVAVPGLSFTDTSGEVVDQSEAHAARLELFAETLRRELAATGSVEVVVPVCDAPCRPGVTPFSKMRDATRAAGANLLLVGGIHKVSTLIGSVSLRLIDLSADRVVCDRALSYRGDSDDAWRRAAIFAAEDVLHACFR